MKLCSNKSCNECPFVKTAIPGWLADYTVEDFVKYFQVDFPFPCHKSMPNGNLSPTVIEPKIKNGELLLCHGYMEMLKKSCKKPKAKWLADVLDTITLTENSLNIQEFIEHHKNK